jgi:type IV pilus assembly protein PilB
MEKRRTIGELLMEYGFIDEADLREGLAHQKETGQRLGEALVALGTVTHQDIEWILSKQLDIPFVIVDDTSIDLTLLTRFSRDFLSRNRILPMYENEETVAVVTDDPFNAPALETVEDRLGKKVTVSAGAGEKIERILRKHLRREGVPELVQKMEQVCRSITETSFYRFDFFLSHTETRASVFGAGRRREVLRTEARYARGDVFNAFHAMGMPFLYEEHRGDAGTMLSLYPVLVKLNLEEFVAGDRPIILSNFGLGAPNETIFTPLRISGVAGVFHSAHPVPGYRYFPAWRPETAPEAAPEAAIYTLDTAPASFEDFSLKGYIPRTCGSCLGAGCAPCRQLGSTFERVEGVYSASQIRALMER